MNKPTHRIAVSGHRGLPEHTARLVDEAIRAALAAHAPEMTGLSCLADGADQIFACAVTDLGGKLEAVIPADKYRDRLPEHAHRGYDDLLAQAVTIHRLPFTESTAESHMAASKLMIGKADELYAVWDGKPARGYGGTADVVAYAREHGTPVRVIWPEGAERDLARPERRERRRARREVASLPGQTDHHATMPGLHGIRRTSAGRIPRAVGLPAYPAASKGRGVQ